MLNLLHYVPDVLRETESRLSLLDDDPFIPFVLQPKIQFELLVG